MNRLPGKSAGKRASILLFTVIVMVSTGVATIAWLGYMSHMQTSARRDRARIQAMNAAEAGVEMIINFCNGKGTYNKTLAAYTTLEHEKSPYVVTYHYYKNNGDLDGPITMPQQENVKIFEPYIITLRVNGDNVPVDEDGNDITDNTGLLTTAPPPGKTSFLRNQADPLSSKIPSFVVYDKSIHSGVFAEQRDVDGNLLGEVTRVVFIHPKDFVTYGDPAPLPKQRVVGKVLSTATTPENVEVTVEMVLTENGALLISSPGAIISHALTDFSGQFNAFWGAVYSQSTIYLPSPFLSRINPAIEPSATKSGDPWLRIWSKGYLKDVNGTKYANGGVVGGWGDEPPTAPAERVKQPFWWAAGNRLDGSIQDDYEGGPPAKGPFDGKYYLHLEQLTPRDVEKISYLDYREFFLSYGLPYYYTDPSGNVYGKERNPDSENYGKVVKKTFAEWFHASVDYTDLADYWDIDEMLAFIDGPPVNDEGAVNFVDGIPVLDDTYYPRDPQDPNNAHMLDKIMATVAHGGSGSAHTRGLIMLANNLEWKGGGSPPTYDQLLSPDHTPENPDPYFRAPDGASDGDATATKRNRKRFLKQYNGGNNPTPINHNGLMYSFGHMTNSGSVSAYGSIVAEHGFRGNGSREVWYNYRLRNGSWLNINQSYVRRNQWAMRTKAVPAVANVAADPV